MEAQRAPLVPALDNPRRSDEALPACRWAPSWPVEVCQVRPRTSSSDGQSPGHLECEKGSSLGHSRGGPGADADDDDHQAGYSVPAEALSANREKLTDTHSAREWQAGKCLSLIMDPGSAHNLCGDKWAEAVAKAAVCHGRRSTYEERMTPRKVVGVGHDPQFATHDYTLPISLRLAESQGVSSGTTTAPIIANSDLSGLLGLESLRENKAVIDFGTQRQYFAGPDEYNLHPASRPDPSGSQCDLTPSGHLVLPCRCLLYTSPSPRDRQKSRMPSSA